MGHGLKALALVAMMAGSVAAHAIPLGYSIAYTAGEGGGTNGTGSFTYDAETAFITNLVWDFGGGMSGSMPDRVYVIFDHFSIALGDWVLLDNCPYSFCGIGFDGGLSGAFRAVDWDTGYAEGPRYLFTPRDGSAQYFGTFVTTPSSQVPEPDTLVLLGLGLLGLGFTRRRPH